MNAPSGRLPAALLATLLLAPAAARAADPAPPAEPEPPRVEWTPGPATVDLGRDVAEVKLPETLAFAGAADTRKLLELMGNVPQGTELGLVVPRADDQDWFIVFRFDGVGYVKDDEKGAIDADGLLESIREGTAEANEERKKRGMPTIDVVGWQEPPHYDERTHHLTWAILGRGDDGHEVVNYNVRVLGRTGVMELKLVESAERWAAARPAVDEVLAAFAYKPGKTYSEWRPGDKVAEYGLTALVAAGAGAAAVKTGLLAALGKFLGKAWKLVAVALAALAAAVGKAVRALRGRGEQPLGPPASPADPAP